MLPPGMHPQPSGLRDMYGVGQLPNPFYSTANQFVPRNYQDVLKWSRFILTQSPTTAEVIRKISSYPITDINVRTAKEAVKTKYENVIKSINLKQKAIDHGFDYYSLGNTFSSIYFPVDRRLVCPKCKVEIDCREALDSKLALFKRWQFIGRCPDCQSDVTYKRKDLKSYDISRINLVKWKPENISLNHNPITGDTDYYYSIPGDVKRKILMGDPLFLSTIDWGLVEAVRLNKEFRFDKSNFYHMKSISMGNMVDGLGMPILISLYGWIFYQAMLRKANEAVAAEHMVPLRVLYPQQGSNKGDPISMMSTQNFVKNVQRSLQFYKKDPNHIMLSPVPVGYQNVGGQGRSLLVSQEMQFAEESALMGLGVSRELLSGTTNWTSSDVGLRLLENNMNHYCGQMRDFIGWVMEKIARYLKIEIIDVELTPFRLSDNQQAQQMMLELWKAQLISNATMLDTFGVDYSKEMTQLAKERIQMAEREIKVTHQIDVAKFMANKDIANEGQDDNGYKQNMDMAYEVAQQMMQSTSQEDFEHKMMMLQKNDSTLYAAVVNILQAHQGSVQGTSSPGDQGEAASETMS